MEIEPLRRIGYALTETQMQTYLDKYSAAARTATSTTRDMTNSMYENSNAAILNANYIGAKVRSLNDAQKEELRYVMILDQSVRAQGDMARTLNSPANQLRIFRQELNMAARAIGNVFIPMLNAIIPVAIAVAQIIREVMNAIAAFFGFTIPEVDYGGFSAGVSDAATGVGNLGDGLDKTTGSAKKAKKALNDLLGPMDELHILNQDTGDTGGGGAGGGGSAGGIGGGGLGLFDKLPEYNMFKDAISNQVDAIKKKIKELLPVIAAVTTALLAWKIGKKIFQNLDAIKAAMRALGMVNVANPWKVLLGWLGVVAGELLFLTGFYDSLFNTASLGSFVKMLAGAAVVAGVLSKVLGKTKLAFISLAANGILMAVAGLKDFLTGKYSAWSAIEAITGIAVAYSALNKISPTMQKWGAPIALLASGLLGVYAASKNLAQGDASLPVLALSVASVGASGLGAFKVVKSLATIFPVLGSAALPIAGIVAAATAGFLAFKYATSDALNPVDLFAGKLEITDEKLREIGFTTVEVSEKTKEAVGNFLDAWDVLNQQTIAVDWSGIAPSQEQLSEISSSLGKVSQTLIDSTEDMRTKSTEALAGVRDALGDSYNQILSKTNQYYDDSKSTIKKQSEEIMKIYQTAYDEERGLTEKEAALIEEIKQKWRTTGIQNLSESALESQIILQNLKDHIGQITAEAAAEAIKNAKTQKEETIKEAEEQYQQILLEAEKMHQVGAINDEEYAQIRKAAEETKASQIKSAEDAYNGIVNTAKEKMGTMGKYFDTETGEMKSKWAIFCIDIKEGFAGIPAQVKEDLHNLKNWFFGTSDEIEVDSKATMSAIETVSGNTAAVIAQKFGVMSADTKKALEEIAQAAKNMFDTAGNAAQTSMDIAKNAVDSATAKTKTEFKTAAADVGNSFDYMHQKAASTAKNIPTEFTNVHSAINNAISWTQVGKIGENISKGIFEGMKGALNNLASRYASQMIQNLTQSFVIHSPSVLAKDKVGIYIGQGIGEGMIEGVKEYTDDVASIVSDMAVSSASLVSDVTRMFNDISYTPSIDYQALINQAEEAGDLASAALYEKIRNAKIEDLNLDYEMSFKYNDTLSDQLSGNNEQISNLSDLIATGQELSNAYQSTDLTTSNQISESLTGFSKSFSDAWKDFKTIFTESKDTIVQLIKTNHDSLTALLNNQFSRTIDAVNNIRINIYNNYYSSGFASGGFPSMGDMFVANEAGAELIGSINGRTAVVNNDQIVAAVSQGVASAVAAVMSQQKQQPIDLYLDGEKIYSNQQKIARTKGIKFDMGAFTR